MDRSLFALLLLVAGFGCAPTVAPIHRTLHTQAWLGVESENFSVWTNHPEPVARQFVKDLELFRRVTAFVIGVELPVSQVPVRVIAFDTQQHYAPFAPGGSRGYFADTLRDDLMVNSGYCACVSQHEYVHFLIQNHHGVTYSRWYDEGLAEFLSATRVRNSLVEIGGVPESRPPRLKSRRNPELRIWSPVVDILSVGVGEQRPRRFYQFYPQSWALVHYLHFGRAGSQNTRKQLADYFRATQRGTSVPDAVQQAFGVSVDELDRSLREYVARNEYKMAVLDVERFGEVPDPSVEPLAPQDVAVVLGRLSLEMERAEQAQVHFEAALALAPQLPAALSGLADSYELQARAEEAEARHRDALLAAPDDAFVHLEWAHFLSRRAEQEEDPARRAELAAHARREFVMSWKLDESIPETYAYYGATFLIEGEDAEQGLETLTHALEARPSSFGAMELLASLQLKAGNAAEARRLALVAHGAHHFGENERIIDVLEKTGGVPGAAPIDD